MLLLKGECQQSELLSVQTVSELAFAAVLGCVRRQLIRGVPDLDELDYWVFAAVKTCTDPDVILFNLV